MPTLAMIDMAKQVLAVVVANESQVTQLNAEQGAKIHELLSTAAAPSFVMVDPYK